jgi:hypothetical protein
MAITKLSDSSITTGDKYISMLAGNLPNIESYESIATVTVGSGGSSSIQFTSIPQTYTHLQLRGIERTTYASNVDSTYIVINGVGSGVFNYHTVRGNGESTFSSYGATAIIGFQAGSGANNTAGVFSGVIVDILDYKDTNKYKTIRTLEGFDNNGNGRINLGSTLCRDTAAITSIYIENGAGNHAQYTQYALYGIKGA